MSYKDLLKKQISELKSKIEQTQGDKQILEDELRKLELKEFEEELATESTQVLLKG